MSKTMPKQNLNSNLARIQNLKALAGSIAHETRNPLASIKQGCDIIKNCLDEAMGFLDLISTSSARGLMVSKMILANIREEKIDESKFIDLSIAKIVKSTIREFAFESEKEKEFVNVDLENDFVFKGDETMAIFVLINLLKNSLYYKAKINIWLDADKKCLYFKDDGAGIPADKLEFIFDDFFTSDKKDGTGLGLPFCKRVMQAFGGNISCQSIVGEGVEFCLWF